MERIERPATQLRLEQLIPASGLAVYAHRCSEQNPPNKIRISIEEAAKITLLCAYTGCTLGFTYFTAVNSLAEIFR